MKEEGNGLFAGMEFYIPPGVLGRSDARAMIQAQGGTIASHVTGLENQIVLMDRHKIDHRNERKLAVEYISDCIKQNKLLPPHAYMGDGEWSPMPVVTKSHPKKKYTDLERGAMLAFVVDKDRDYNKPLSRKFWDLAAAQQITDHSSESMHEHYRKQLVNKIPAEKNQLIDLYRRSQSDDGAAPSAVPPIPTVAVPPPRSPTAVQKAAANVPRPVKTLSPRLTTPPPHRPRTTPPPRHEISLPRLESGLVDSVSQVSSPLEVPSRKRLRTELPSQVASTQQVDIWFEELQAATGVPRVAAAHALYASSGNPRVALMYLRNQLPRDCWQEDEDAWILRNFNDLPNDLGEDEIKTHIRRVLREDQDPLPRRQTVQLIWQRLQFLKY
ncbi:hypothetical protein LEN26_008277 [Aphanomyces euteiches]|nr:hypothetical protein AeMF1_013964 [Aphanomyces euteiches]KAH9130693.1 hypothetical protein LEN26_008277 [Aphanomyces euteiches]KAH9185017.1 hypothetical protein AeNC1_013013 [Aphanomyces euteiches]